MTDLHINGLIGSTIEIDDDRLIVERDYGDGLLGVVRARTGMPYRVEDPITGEPRLPDTAWLERMMREGRFRIVRDGDGRVVLQAQAFAGLDHDEINALDPMARIRVDVVRALSKRGVGCCDPDLSTAIDAVWTDTTTEVSGERPTTATVRRWMRRDDPELATLAGMMSRSGRVKRARKLQEPVLRIVEQAALWFYSSRGIRQTAVQAKVAANIDALNVERNAAGFEPVARPSRETVRRQIQAYHCRDNYARKHGETAAKKRFNPSGRGLRALRILQIGLMDDTILDTIAVFDAERSLPAGRPYLCILMDVHSRCIVGWLLSFEPPSVHTAAEVLRRANRPKTIRSDLAARYPVLMRIAGKFDDIVFDNGTNYVADDFRAIMADLGITMTLAPVASPTYKAMVERFFATLKTWLLEQLPGATMDPKAMREIGYDPERSSVLTLNVLRLLIDTFICAYHVELHSGIDQQPAAAWQRSMEVHGRNVIRDERVLDVLTMNRARGRRLTRNGITFAGLRYHDPEAVAALLEESAGIEKVGRRIANSATGTVDIRYDPMNLGSILVYGGKSDMPVRLPCTTPDYAEGLGLWQHKQIREWTVRENREFNTPEERLSARNELNKLIRQVAPDLAARERRAIARMTEGGFGNAVTSGVVIERAPHRHDGMGEILHDPAAETRTDADRSVSNPAKPTPLRERARTDVDPRSEGEEDLPTARAANIWTSPDDEDRRFQEYA
ncbi:MAG: Mu transposase C-terminal domain-containing protein [Janthinobacterium lividum]